MELLLTKNPIIGRIHSKSVGDHFKDFVEKASLFNVATGFISNDSIAALKQILEFREGALSLNLFIGMNYLDGFTKLQYNAIKDLDSYLQDNQLGHVYLSPSALYHGKMYSFEESSKCIGSFVGSSNLGSFVGTGNNYIESDVLFFDSEAQKINQTIYSLIELLGKQLSDLPEVTKFVPPDVKVLKDFSYVEELLPQQLDEIKCSVTGKRVVVPLKVEAKSNLNTYFGKGKIKGKYSPRGWYEVELILPQALPNKDLFPDRYHGPFHVVTSDGFAFDCERQGTNSKNLRSSKDLKILGRWIKGQMENEGALRIGEPVTLETLERFGKRSILFEETSKNVWIISLV